MRSRQTRVTLKHGDIHLPILIVEENRTDTRVSIGKSTAYLRLPFHASREYKHEKLDWAKKWLIEALLEKPGMADRWKSKIYTTGQIIQTPFKNYTLHLERSTKHISLRARIENDIVRLSLPVESNDEWITREDISTIISKVVSKDLMPAFTHRVKELNSLHFQEKYNDIKLKYTHTRWGSCATSGNLNFSTRILLAPTPVMNHVIIHELAHLKEMNHSHKFWSWVAKADPDYKHHDKWLSQQGEKLVF